MFFPEFVEGFHVLWLFTFWRRCMLRSTFLVLCFSFAGVLCGARDTHAQARYDTISAGQEKGWFLDEGLSLVVAYCPNGSAKTAAWKQNWFNWIVSDPLVVVNIYYSPGWWCPAFPIYSTSADAFYKNYRLTNTSGIYFFEFRCYRSSTPVYLKIY